MDVKKMWSIMVVILSIAVMGAVSCKAPSSRGGARISGDGTTPARAIVITPTTVQQKSQPLQITVSDSYRWFYSDLSSGRTYSFETTGSGDPILRIYARSQVKANGARNGDPVAQDDDGAADGRNSKVRFSPSNSGGYYLLINLYAGSRWSGTLKYIMN